MNLIEMHQVARSFVLEEHTVEAVREADLTLAEGESIGIIGVSGAGKSTLLHMLGGLERPTRGELLFRGKPLYGRGTERLLDQYRRDAVGFVFQFHYLIEELDALENVALSLRIQRVSPAESARRAEEILCEVGLSHRLNHRPAQLSGGEQQRVSIARALVHRPALLLADEPTGNLDQETGRAVATLLIDLCRSRSMAMVVATHNQELAHRLDRHGVMVDGILKFELTMNDTLAVS